MLRSDATPDAATKTRIRHSTGNDATTDVHILLHSHRRTRHILVQLTILRGARKTPRLYSGTRGHPVHHRDQAAFLL